MYWDNYLKALLFSILVEFVILILLFKPVTGIAISNRWQMLKIFLTCAIATALTLTINWWVFPIFIKVYSVNLVVTELFALLFEGCVYAIVFRISFTKALFLSAACNLLSYAYGLLLVRLGVIR